MEKESIPYSLTILQVDLISNQHIDCVLCVNTRTIINDIVYLIPVMDCCLRRSLATLEGGNNRGHDLVM